VRPPAATATLYQYNIVNMYLCTGTGSPPAAARLASPARRAACDTAVLHSPWRYTVPLSTVTLCNTADCIGGEASPLALCRGLHNDDFTSHKPRSGLNPVMLQTL
jgi:hypothetical protein